MPPRLLRRPAGKTRQVWAWLAILVHAQPKVVVSHTTLPGGYVHAKNQKNNPLLQQPLMIKESWNLV